jgi:hypothetical protein
MPQQADGVYAPKPWGEPGSPVVPLRPWGSNEERLTVTALASVANLTAEQISQIRPPLPRVQLFPPRFGYRIDAFGIRDVVNVNTVYPGARIDYSGSNSGYQGTSFPALGVF